MGFYKDTVNSFIYTSSHKWGIFRKVDGFEKWHDSIYTVTGRDEGIGRIKSVRGKEKRLELYDLNLIQENDVYEWFFELVKNQSLKKTVLRNQETGEEKAFLQGGRWCMTDKAYEKKLIKKFKKKLGKRSNIMFLSLTIDRRKVFEAMPPNTNLPPIAWAIMNVGKWTSDFMQSLKAYHRKFNRRAKKNGTRPIRAYFVGWVLEEQEESGWPHIHMIWVSNYIGQIQEVAELWPWGGDDGQGVDYVDRKKLERLRKEKGLKANRTNVVNYVIKYIGKNRKNSDVQGSVSKTMAWIAFFGVRLFNLSHKYAEAIIKKAGSVVWKFVNTYMVNNLFDDEEIFVKEGMT
ncbi:MAG: hypothetical protein ACYDHW_05300 [Syntrophorhabdaceae bacterium]